MYDHQKNIQGIKILNSVKKGANETSLENANQKPCANLRLEMPNK